MTAVLCAFAGTIRAEGFNPSVVPASACWILHLDMSGLKETDIGRALLATPAVMTSPQLSEFTTRFGLDPKRDLRGATAYTVSTGRLDAVAVLDPVPAAEARLKAWRESGGFVGQAYGTHTIYTRPAGSGVPFYAVTQDGRIVTALTLENVRQALDVLDGKKEALAASTLPALADRKAGDGAVLLIAGRAFGPEMQGVLPQISLLKKANSLCLALTAKAGQVTVALSVCADDEPESERLQNALLGLMEVGRALAANDGRSDLIQAVIVTREGKTVRADGSWKADEVLKMIGGPRGRSE